MVIAVMVRGSKLPTRGDMVEKALPLVPRPERIARPALLGMVFGGVALIVLPYDFRQAAINSIIATTLILSLVVITGYVGQISVVQLALSGVAGFVMSHLATDHGIGFPGNAILGVLVATVLGLGIGLVGLRVRGVQLALVSLAATVAIERFWFGSASWGGGTSGAPIGEPTIFGVDLGPNSSFRGLDGNLPSPALGFLCLACAVALCAFVAHVRRTNFGEQMVVLRSNERAAASVGINVRRVKIYAFTLSSAIAGVAGVLYAINFSSVSADRFSALNGLAVVAFAYIGGITLVPGAILAGAIGVEAFFPHFWERFAGLSGTTALLLGGVFLIVNLIYYPSGFAGEARRKREFRKAGLTYESEFSRSGIARGTRRALAAIPVIGGVRRSEVTEKAT
jgi:branched-chain amino acid transport system permease protein